MAHQRHYKRNEIIDEESESLLIASMISIALESKGNGWTVDNDDSKIQRKRDKTTKRAIYRGIVQNKSNVTYYSVY